MLRSKPKFKYCGLTIVLSNPSRFDKLSLLSANGGSFFVEHCLQPEFNQMMCDIRLLEDTSPFLPDTLCVLLLGEHAMHHYCPDSRGNTLNELRGSPLLINGINAIASYFPQDCVDIKQYEQTLNPNSKEYVVDGDEYTPDEDEGDVKKLSPTARRNYGFWLKQDTKKCKSIIRLGGKIPERTSSPLYKTYPTSDEVTRILTETKGQHLYFDIETDYEQQNLLCFSFSFDGVTVYNVPVLDNEYHPAYSSIHFILRALAIAMRDNITVAHNGAAFDFFVMAVKYQIPIGRCYDTMLATHRCFPDIEKSLGHCTSLWTWEKFHKDTDSRSYMTREHMTQKMHYCGKDVYTMALIHKAITKYATTIPGLSDSIETAMASIRPYLTTTVMGIRYSQEKVEKLQKENDRLMMQYMRCIKLLIGEIGMAACSSSVKGKAKSFPGSQTQCVNYFHEQLGYQVVARSSITQKPSLAKGAMFKLALKHDNPVITFTLLFRGLQTESSKGLRFNPWRGDNGKILPRTKPLDGQMPAVNGAAVVPYAHGKTTHRPLAIFSPSTI